MKSLVSTSNYVNHNRLATGDYSRWQRYRVIASGVLQALASNGLPVQKPRVACNMCGWKGKKFMHFYTGYGHVYENAVCPACYSHPRHRSYAYCLEELLGKKSGQIKVLHFSPEFQIVRLLKRYPQIDYLSVDIDHTKAMRREDITQLSLPDNTYDLIICIHVLEHINDDAKAMSEILRVLKPGGAALLDVPIDHDRETTWEDDTITSPEARTEAFWQWDHVRLYGRDYPDKLRSSGFEVEERDIVGKLGRETINLHGLVEEPNFICTKAKII